MIVNFGQAGVVLIAGTPSVLFGRGTGKKQTSQKFFSFLRTNKINWYGNSKPLGYAQH